MTLTPALIESLLTEAASAPSAHNTQPWVPEITDCTAEVAQVRVGVDPARLLPHGDPRSEDLHLGMGCWVESLVIAAAEAGVRTESVTVRGRGPTLDIRLRLTATESMASVESTAGPTRVESALTDGSAWPRFGVADLHHRQVDRGPLKRSDPRFAEATEICRNVMAETAVRLVEVPDDAWRGWLRRAALHSYGNRSVFTETLRWLRFDTDDPAYDQDGLTAECLRIPALGARAAAALARPWLHSWITGLASVSLAPVALARAAISKYASSGRGSRIAVLPRSLRESLSSTAAPAEPTKGSRPKRRHPHHLVLAVPDRPALTAADEVEIGRVLLRTWLTFDRHGLRVDVHSELKDSPTVRDEVATFLRGRARGHTDCQEFDRPIAAFTVGSSTTPVPRAPRLSPF